MGIKLSKALGHKVVAISTSESKKEAATKIGADMFVVSSSEEQMKAHASTCDLLLNTVSAEHSVMTYVPLLKTNGIICQLGLVTKPHAVYIDWECAGMGIQIFVAVRFFLVCSCVCGVGVDVVTWVLGGMILE